MRAEGGVAAATLLLCLALLGESTVSALPRFGSAEDAELSALRKLETKANAPSSALAAEDRAVRVLEAARATVPRAQGAHPFELARSLPLDEVLDVLSAFTPRQAKPVVFHGRGANVSASVRDLEVVDVGGTDFVYPYTQNIIQQLFVHTSLRPAFDNTFDDAALRAALARADPAKFGPSELAKMTRPMLEQELAARSMWRANLQPGSFTPRSAVPTHAEVLPLVRPSEYHETAHGRRYVTEQHQIKMETFMTRDQFVKLAPVVSRLPPITQIGRLVRIFQDLAEFRSSGAPLPDEAFAVTKEDIAARIENSLQSLSLRATSSETIELAKARLKGINYAWQPEDSPPRSWPQGLVSVCHFVRYGLTQRSLISERVQRAAEYQWSVGRAAQGNGVGDGDGDGDGDAADDVEMDYAEFVIKMAAAMGNCNAGKEGRNQVKDLVGQLSEAVRASPPRSEEAMQAFQETFLREKGVYDTCRLEPSVMQVMYNMFELDAYQQGLDEPRAPRYLSTCEWTLAFAFLSEFARRERESSAFAHDPGMLFDAWASLGIHDLESLPVVPREEPGDDDALSLSEDARLGYTQFRDMLQTIDQGNALVTPLEDIGVDASIDAETGRAELAERNRGDESTMEFELLDYLSDRGKARPTPRDMEEDEATTAAKRSAFQRLQGQPVVFDMFGLFEARAVRPRNAVGKGAYAEELFDAAVKALDSAFLRQCGSSFDPDTLGMVTQLASAGSNVVTRFHIMALMKKSDPGIDCTAASLNSAQVWKEAGHDPRQSEGSMDKERFVQLLQERPVFLDMSEQDVKNALTITMGRDDSGLPVSTRRIRYMTASQFMQLAVVAAEYREYRRYGADGKYLDLLAGPPPPKTGGGNSWEVETKHPYSFSTFFELFTSRYFDVRREGGAKFAFFAPEHSFHMQKAQWCGVAKAILGGSVQCPACAKAFSKWSLHFSVALDAGQDWAKVAPVVCAPARANQRAVCSEVAAQREAQVGVEHESYCAHEVCALDDRTIADDYLRPFAESFALPAPTTGIGCALTALCGPDKGRDDTPLACPE